MSELHTAVTIVQIVLFLEQTEVRWAAFLFIGFDF